VVASDWVEKQEDCPGHQKEKEKANDSVKEAVASGSVARQEEAQASDSVAKLEEAHNSVVKNL
jgi:hypothetical protein